MQLLTFVALLVGAASALAESSEVEGIQNCYNKCDKVFDRTQYAISDQPGADTFEYRSCVLGCDKCSAQLTAGATDDQCFGYCKKYDYTKAKIRKGVIEPDKACIIGCIINTCQKICIGGTTDNDQTPANAQYWWNSGVGNGCALKGGLGYVQAPEYGNPNSPGGQGADDKVKQCCTNAFNLCNYNGDTASTNYKNVVVVSQRSCKKLVKSQNIEKICAWYNEPQNCGTQGMSP